MPLYIRGRGEDEKKGKEEEKVFRFNLGGFDGVFGIWVKWFCPGRNKARGVGFFHL